MLRDREGRRTGGREGGGERGIQRYREREVWQKGILYISCGYDNISLKTLK